MIKSQFKGKNIMRNIKNLLFDGLRDERRYMKNRKVLLLLSVTMVLSIIPFTVWDKAENCIAVNDIEKINICDEDLTATAGIAKELYSFFQHDDERTVENEEIHWNHGWINASCVNIRADHSAESEILGKLNFNDSIEYYYVENNWCRIIFNDDTAYVCSDYIDNKEMKYTDYSMPKTSGFKSFMSYRAITDTKSYQYKLQSVSYTGKYGIRQVNNRYCVAVGTAFSSEIGVYFDLILENGEVIPCILGDVKSNRHTNAQNIITLSNGCASEFIVDTNCLNKNVKISGDISSSCKAWKSRIVTIRVYEKNIFDK